MIRKTENQREPVTFFTISQITLAKQQPCAACKYTQTLCSSCFCLCKNNSTYLCQLKRRCCSFALTHTSSISLPLLARAAPHHAHGGLRVFEQERSSLVVVSRLPRDPTGSRGGLLQGGPQGIGVGVGVIGNASSNLFFALCS